MYFTNWPRTFNRLFKSQVENKVKNKLYLYRDNKDINNWNTE